MILATFNSKCICLPLSNADGMKVARAQENRRPKTHSKYERTAAHAERTDVILVVQCQLSSVEVEGWVQ